MILHDAAIRAHVASGIIGIEPFDDARVQPASVDLTLGTEFGYYKAESGTYIDPETFTLDALAVFTAPPSGVLLRPQDFILAHTTETVTLPPDVGAMCLGVSTLARLGLQVEAAGWVDPGFSGQLTLEIVNHNHRAILLQPGMVIAQIKFEQCLGPAERPYGVAGLGSRYMHQRGSVGPRVKG